jgi:hypothetical protein
VTAHSLEGPFIPDGDSAFHGSRQPAVHLEYWSRAQGLASLGVSSCRRCGGLHRSCRGRAVLSAGDAEGGSTEEPHGADDEAAEQGDEADER